MPFWKKSDDPWDTDPVKERAKREREPVENPLDGLKEWNEERKAKAAEKRAELEAQPKEVCPWCGKEMERGYLSGEKGIFWTPGFLTVKSALLGPSKEARERRLRVDDEGAFFTSKIAWYCGECKKIVIDAKGMQRVNAPYAWPEEPQSPYEEELYRYFKESKQSGEEEDTP